MKKFIKISAGCLLLGMAALQAGAQNQAAPEVKAIGPDKTLQSAGRNATVTDIKTPAGPAAPSFQKGETPQAASVSAPVYPAADAGNPVIMGANKYKWTELKAYPRPQLPAPANLDLRTLQALPLKETAPAIVVPSRS